MSATPAETGSATATTTSSGRLLAQAHAGDATAFGRLLGRCLPELTRWAHRRLPRWARTAADTSDLIQDAALHTFRRFGALDVRSRHALAAYLREAVRHRIADEHRRIGRRGVHEGLADDLTANATAPDEHAIEREREARYRDALARLSAQDRELIVAHVELEYSHEQIGCMTGRSRNAARMALERAIRRLAELMQPRDA